MRFSTFLELAPQVGIEVPKQVSSAQEQFLVLEPMHDLQSVLHKFLATQKVLASKEILQRLAFECIEDAYLDGIRILELRWSPGFILDGHPQLKAEKILEAFLRGQEQALIKYPLAVGHLGIIQRNRSLEEGLQRMQFFIDHKDCFVGVDLADDENFAPTKSFANLFQKAHQAGLKVTIHAGEAPGPHSAQNVLDAVNHLGASRIGHGLQIFSDPKICAELAKKKIPLELCLWSNFLTGASLTIEQHPIRQLLQQGLRVTINTDDPGIFNIDLTHEYELLKSHFQFTNEEFAICNDWAAEASFISHAEKQKVWPRTIRQN